MKKRINYIFWYSNQLVLLLKAIFLVENIVVLATNFWSLINQNADVLVNFRTIPEIKFKIRDLYDLLGFYEIFVGGSYKKLFKNYSGKEATFIDIGAYNGDSSLYASRYKFVKKIISVEPNPENFAFLEKNINLNKISSITILNKAVCKGKEIKLFLHKNNRQTGILKKRDNQKAITATCVSLEKLIDNCRGDIFVKCDVEGAEYEIFLNTPARCLKKLSRLIIEYHGTKELKNLIAKLEKSGMMVELVNNRFLKGFGYIYCYSKSKSFVL